MDTALHNLPIALYRPDLGIWYNQLIDDCQSIITECEFTARWSLIEGYHQVGLRIIQAQEDINRCSYGEQIVDTVAKTLGKSSRTIHYAVSVARQYPILDDIPLGKNTSWRQVIKLIDNGKPAKECTHDQTELITRCKTCHKIL